MVNFSVEKLQQLARLHPPFKGVKGSIVRLKIIDFMTYHKVELRAGSNVNLIIGPNGTGKSTIVCAICIGLAGKPKILGRASSLKEYIRHGCTSAIIEIELYNPGGNNYVIKRYIKETITGASSQWSLNGKKVPPNQIETLLVNLNIQLDNLCQFLPQDRVQEFSKMDAYSLLRSTQQAMGKNTLIEKHDRLMKLNEMVRQIEHTLKSTIENLRAEQQYNQRLENEVKNFHERERMKEKIESLTSKKAWLVFVKSHNSYLQLNSELGKLRAKKKQEDSMLLPMKKSVQMMETRLIKFRQEMNNCRSQSTSVMNSVKRKYEDECDKIEVKVNEINSEVQVQETSENDRQKRLQTICQKLEALQREKRSLEEKGDLDQGALQMKIKNLQAKSSELSKRIFEIEGLNDTDEADKRIVEAHIRKAENEIRNLDDLRVSRMKFLQREHRDAYQAVEFFSKAENRTRLKGNIYEPMILHINVNDLKYGALVERHIGMGDMTSYFCDDRDDLEVMLQLTTELGIRISIIHHDKPHNFRRPPAPYKPEFLRKYGFDRVLLDLIQAPDYYLSYICERHRPQIVPIGAKATDEKFGLITAQTNLAIWYTEKSAYSVKKSYYGDVKCSSLDFIGQARVFTKQINASEAARLEQVLKDCKLERKRYDDQIKSRTPELHQLVDDRKGLEDGIKDIRGKMDYAVRIRQNIQNTETSKRGFESESVDIERLKKNAVQSVLKERKKVVDLFDWVVSEIVKNSKQGVQFLVLKRQISMLQRRIITKQGELEDLEATLGNLNGQIKKLEEQVKSKQIEAEKNKKEAMSKSPLTEPPPDVAKGEIDEDEVDKELNLARVQIGFLVVTDGGIVKDYQERLKKIDRLTLDRGANEGRLEELKNEIVINKKEWLEPLNQLIFRINDNFGRFFANMNCAGEVSLCVGEDEDDFAKYGIKIMVKFRASEPLAEMCGSKGGTLQSGGERVITTALYVLALQELTVVPFRVIDEINQGMDAKNESRFFTLLCSMAKGENTPQYFLLTPKMLPPVDYPDNVEFHFIMNGPKVDVPFDENESDIEEEDHSHMEDDD